MRMLTAHAHDVPDKDGHCGDWFLFLKPVDRQSLLDLVLSCMVGQKVYIEITLSLPMTPLAGII